MWNLFTKLWCYQWKRSAVLCIQQYHGENFISIVVHKYTWSTYTYMYISLSNRITTIYNAHMISHVHQYFSFRSIRSVYTVLRHVIWFAYTVLRHVIWSAYTVLRHMSCTCWKLFQSMLCTYYIELHVTQLRILKSDPTFDNSMTPELFIVFSCLDIIHFDQLSLFHSYKLIGNNRIVTKIDIIISN